MRNYFLATIGLFFCIHLSGQSLYLDGITLSNSAFGYYDETGIIVANSSPVSLTVGSAGNYELTANRVIELKRGFYATAGSSTTNHFKAEIGNQGLDVVILEPDTITAVPLYNKVEFGISVPSLETRINRFLNDTTGHFKPGTDRYNDSLESGYLLNPYDPAHISIDAVFLKPSDPNQNGVVRHGFFYNEYERDLDSLNWDDVYTGIDPYEWRVRFSPTETGTWRGFINVYVNNVKLPENYFFTFTVVSSNNPGFVEVASNNQFLKFSNGDQFFPVGDNYAFPFCDQGCSTRNCVNQYDHRYQPNNWDKNEKYIERLTNSANGGEGGNHSRLWMTPWGYEIEWERLGNYQSRQIEMFELDNYFELCETNNVYLILVTATDGNWRSEPGFWGLTNYSEKWEWNPYNGLIAENSAPYNTYNDPNRQHKGIDGVENSKDFFTNQTAQQFYKNKLRYIESRWGYSTSFYTHEYCNEIQKCDVNYWSDSTLNIATENWLSEMSSYWKNDLSASSLTTVTYAGDGNPYLGPVSHSTDVNIWYDDNIDIVSGHDYTTRLDGLAGKSTVVKNTINQFEKPCINNEFSFLNYAVVDACNNRQLHKGLWSSVVSGSFGTGMAWEWFRYTVDDWHNAGADDFLPEYVTVRQFVENIDLLNYNYEPRNSFYYYPYYNFPNDSVVTKVQSFYMTRSDKKKVYGWFYNRSYNEYTFDGDCNYFEDAVDDLNNDCIYAKYVNMQDLIMDDIISEDSYLNYQGPGYGTFFPTDYEEYPDTSTTFDLINLIPNTTYKIEYMYTTGPDAGTFESDYDYVFITDAAGHTIITNGPPTGGSYPYDWAYIVHLNSEPRSIATEYVWLISNNDSLNIIKQTINEASLTSLNNIINAYTIGGRSEKSRLYPNPNHGDYSIVIYVDNQISSTIAISDLAGNILYQTLFDFNEGINTIYFSHPDLPSGTYLVRIESLNEIFKLVIV